MIASSSPAAVDLTGELTRTAIEKSKFEWMDTGMKRAAGSAALSSADAAKLSGVEVEVYFGSWCGDSHEYLPDFFAMLDQAKTKSGITPASVKYFALDRKKTYEGYKNPRGIERLPTFVFLRNGKEIGRIIETPKTSVAADTASILSASGASVQR